MSWKVPMVAAVGVAAVLTLPASGDYRQHYRDGIRSLERRALGPAASSFRSAIAENPNESAEKVLIYGNLLLPYLPHFQLGLTLQRSGDCRGALAAFGESARQNVVSRQRSENAALVKARTACESKLPPQVAESAPPERRPQPSAPEPGPQSPVETPQQPPLAAPAPAPAPPLTAETTPASPSTRPGTETVASTPERPLPGTSGRETPVTPQRADENLTAQRESVEILRAAASAYLAGKYAQTTQLLRDLNPADRAARAQTHLFRAAANYAMYALTGRADRSLLGQVMRDVAGYRSLAPNRAPDPRVFSPEFVRLVQRGSGA